MLMFQSNLMKVRTQNFAKSGKFFGNRLSEGLKILGKNKVILKVVVLME